MSLSGDKGVAQFKKSVKMEHPIRQVFVKNYILSGDYVIKDFFFLLLTNSALKEHSFTLFEQNIYRTHGKGETFKHKPLFASEKSTQRNV